MELFRQAGSIMQRDTVSDYDSRIPMTCVAAFSGEVGIIKYNVQQRAAEFQFQETAVVA